MKAQFMANVLNKNFSQGVGYHHSSIFLDCVGYVPDLLYICSRFEHHHS